MPGENVQDWSVTAVNNGTADSLINWAEGMPRASVNNSARSMMAASAKDRNLKNGSIITTGTANAQAFTSGIGYSSVPTGLVVRLKISVTNTGAATLNMDAIGAVTIKDMRGLDLVPGALFAGAYADFVYNGTNWILVNSAAIVGGLYLAQTTVTTQADLKFQNLPANMRLLQINMSDIVPSTAGTNLQLRLSTDNFATEIATGYIWSRIDATHANAISSTGSVNDIIAELMANISTGSFADFNLEVQFFSTHTAIFASVGYITQASAGVRSSFWCNVQSACNAIRFFMVAGNISCKYFARVTTG